jgi:hypothetical protein
MRLGFERRGMSAFKGVVAITDHFDSTFQAAAEPMASQSGSGAHRCIRM